MEAGARPPITPRPTTCVGKGGGGLISSAAALVFTPPGAMALTAGSIGPGVIGVPAEASSGYFCQGHRNGLVEGQGKAIAYLT